MTIETRDIKQTVFIAEDGTEFLSELDCAMYEQKNPYNNIVQDYPHLKNLLFFNQTIDGFFCENQEQIDNCCNWLIQNYLNIGKQIIAVGNFQTPDYYFFINNDTPTDETHIGTYLMMSLKALKLHWQSFLIQLPKSIQDNYLNNIQNNDIDNDVDNNITNKDKELLQITWLNEFLTDKTVHEQFENFIKEKIDNILEETKKENQNVSEDKK